MGGCGRAGAATRAPLPVQEPFPVAWAHPACPAPWQDAIVPCGSGSGLATVMPPCFLIAGLAGCCWLFTAQLCLPSCPLPSPPLSPFLPRYSYRPRGREGRRNGAAFDHASEQGSVRRAGSYARHQHHATVEKAQVAQSTHAGATALISGQQISTVFIPAGVPWEEDAEQGRPSLSLPRCPPGLPPAPPRGRGWNLVRTPHPGFQRSVPDALVARLEFGSWLSACGFDEGSRGQSSSSKGGPGWGQSSNLLVSAGGNKEPTPASDGCPPPDSYKDGVLPLACHRRGGLRAREPTGDRNSHALGHS